MKYLILMITMILLLAGCAEKGDDRTLGATETYISETMHLQKESETIEPSTAATEPELHRLLVDPKNTDFVRICDYIPGILTELKYSTADNFTDQVIYEFEDAYLRYGTVMKLKSVSDELAQHGLKLKIWDGFRPVSAQFKLWDICPDPTYVANPNQGYSNHSRGFAVDLTLVDEFGNELQMPTEFDDFSAKADRDYSDCDSIAAENAQLLESVMEKYGFQGYWGEWWHFNDTEKYDVERYFDPAVTALRFAEKAADLLECYWDGSSAILTVPAGKAVTLLGFCEEYALVEYWGYRGYLPSSDLRE